MPKSVAPGNVDDDPVIVEDDPKPSVAEEKVEIDLEEKETPKPSQEDQIAAKVKADIERLYAGKLEQVESRLKGAQRINTQLQQKYEALERRVTAPAPAPTPAQPTDELQALVDKGDWKTAVGKIAEERAERLYQERMIQQQRQAAQYAQEQTLERAKNAVIERYPDLDPDTGNPESDISRAYVQVMNADPSLLANPYGPEIAMYRMEQALAQAQNGSQTQETSRQTRVNQTSLNPSRALPSNGKVTIDREEKEFIDFHGLDPKTYARMKATLAGQSQVEMP